MNIKNISDNKLNTMYRNWVLENGFIKYTVWETRLINDTLFPSPYTLNYKTSRLNKFKKKMKIKDVENNMTYISVNIDGFKYGQAYYNVSNTREDMISRFISFYFPLYVEDTNHVVTWGKNHKKYFKEYNEACSFAYDKAFYFSVEVDGDKYIRPF